MHNYLWFTKLVDVYSENLTFAKKTGPQTAGIPFTIVNNSETGFQGYGTMGDVSKSENTFMFSELPVHAVSSWSIILVFAASPELWSFVQCASVEDSNAGARMAFCVARCTCGASPCRWFQG